ncbi:helix-turn-helix domain-containing protein [Leptospira barantonii]|uniref:Helix-turn-helix domain-containing protein n=1 Tax=Leptospira barantonii TaxID=2023184 RepID=A0A5F2AYD1_9LEPT|nr:helix-turn-helix domain-containing protein [Leptospira barantonii]TGL93102.1 helix-turn-helix domain-containing protein [Leptospira barantonii]
MSKTEIKPPVFDLAESLPAKKDPLFYVGRLEDLPPSFREYDSSHRHTYFALFFFREGKGTHTIDFREMPIDSNSLFFLKPGQVHSWKFQKQIRGYALKIAPEFYSELGETMNALREFPFFSFENDLPKITVEDPQRLSSDFQRLAEEHGSASDPRMLFALIQVILHQVKKEYENSVRILGTNKNSSVVVSFQGLLEEHFLKERNTNFYSRRLGIAPNTLNRICHDSLGKSVKSVIHERVTLEIKRLLLHSNLNITQISYELGFEDIAYFSRYFKLRSGFSPERFRESRTKNTTK